MLHIFSHLLYLYHSKTRTIIALDGRSRPVRMIKKPRELLNLLKRIRIFNNTKGEEFWKP
jgi:hypothetical protein